MDIIDTCKKYAFVVAIVYVLWEWWIDRKKEKLMKEKRAIDNAADR